MGKVVMKWGGGLITNKNNLCTALPERMKSLAAVVSQIVNLGHQVIIVHGAGSFGHLRAIEYGLAGGRDARLDDGWQQDGIKLVQQDMDALHSHVISSLKSFDLDISSHIPREFVEGIGPNFKGSLTRFITDDQVVHLSYGDIVRCLPPEEFGILSGDDLMLRISTEVPDVSHVIFALGDTPGLMTHTPNNPAAKLIEKWSNGDAIVGSHDAHIDATGGIYLKIERALEISKIIGNVWFVDGCHPERILQLVTEGTTLGTQILP